jgi:tripartite-type tricarboxylate transporter receptor subunit TctC
MTTTRRNMLLRTAAVGLGSAWTAAGAQAQFPTRPLKLVVPFAPGGGGDQVGRMLSPRISASMGHPVVVENRAGAGGAIGSQVAARAEPDGYTALIHSGTLLINPLLSKSAGYDYKTDFTPVGTIVQFPLVLIVHPSLPVKTFAEFLAYARTKGSDLFYGSAGNGSTQNLIGELFNNMAGTKMKHVPFKGNGPATASLLAGDIQAFFDIVPSALAYGQSGKLRPLAVTGPSRSPVLPELPTLQEAGIPGFDFSTWYAVFLPKGAKQAVVQQWQRAVDGVHADTELMTRLSSQGFMPMKASSTELSALMDRDTERWTKVIADAHIRTD